MYTWGGSFLDLIFNMKYSFSLNKKVNLIDLSKHFGTKLGLKLHADDPSDTVNGAIHANYHPAGAKTGKCWCGLDLSTIPEEHTCVIIETYDVSEAPTGNRQSRLKKPLMTKVLQLPTEFDDFVKIKKLKGKQIKKNPNLPTYIKREVDN